MTALLGLLDPGHVVVVGASNSPTSAGATFVRSLSRAQFGGRISIVHPRAEAVGAATGYPTVWDVPEPIDYLIVAVPSTAVEDVVRAASEMDAGLIHVFAGGFAEATEHGTRIQDRLAEIVRASDSRLLGPNCMGLHRPSRGITFRDDMPLLAGPLGLVSQSGGIAIATIRTAARRGLGISSAVSFGNAADVTATELIDALAVDHDTKVIAVYLESANDTDLTRALEVAAQAKPVVVWAAGTQDPSAAAARRHTGQRGGPLAPGAVPATCITVNSVDDLVSVADFATRVHTPRCPAVAFVSISGGYCVSFADLLHGAGGTLSQLRSTTIDALFALYGPSAGNLCNPIDLGGSGFLSRGRLGPLFEALHSDDDVGIIVFHLASDYLKEVAARTPGYLDGYLRALSAAISSVDTPTVVFAPRIEDDEFERDVRKRLVANGIFVLDDSAQIPGLVLHAHRRGSTFDRVTQSRHGRQPDRNEKGTP